MILIFQTNLTSADVTVAMGKSRSEDTELGSNFDPFLRKELARHSYPRTRAAIFHILGRSSLFLKRSSDSDVKP